MIEIGQEIAVFITRSSREGGWYTGNWCTCCEHKGSETYVDTELPLDPDGETGIFLKGKHEDLHGVHIVRALHPYYEDEHTSWHYWELVQ